MVVYFDVKLRVINLHRDIHNKLMKICLKFKILSFNMGKCSFKNDWLLKTDCNGMLYSKWVKKFSTSEAFCVECEVKFTVVKGIQALSQHAGTAGHKDRVHIKLHPLQLHLKPCDDIDVISNSNILSTNNSVQPKCGTIALWSVKDSGTRAEIIWVLKSVVSYYSATSSDGIKETFKEMFPQSVPEDFSMSRVKMGYLITDGLAPYFKRKLVDDVLQSPYYTVQYDETTNEAGKRELQVMTRYWSVDSNQIETCHLETFFLGKATGEELFKHINMAIDNVNLPRKLLMLRSDGPNVNKIVQRLMTEDMKSFRQIGLMDLGTCTIHTMGHSMPLHQIRMPSNLKICSKFLI